MKKIFALLLLFLLDANPLDAIGSTKKIAAIVISGKLIPKTQLALMLAEV